MVQGAQRGGDPAAAPLDPDAVAAALEPFGSSRTLPAQAYTDAAVLAWERRHLFAGGWAVVGRVDELREGVTQRAVTVGDVGVLLTFQEGAAGPGDGAGIAVRAFANVCRHRGHELLADGASTARVAAV